MRVSWDSEVIRARGPGQIYTRVIYFSFLEGSKDKLIDKFLNKCILEKIGLVGWIGYGQVGIVNLGYFQ